MVVGVVYAIRIGRTARAGKGGSGVLMCAPFEERVMRKELSDLPLVTVPLTATGDQASTQAMIDAQKAIADEANGAWAAWLGFYNRYRER